MLEIEKYIKKHVGRKVLLTLTFSPSPVQQDVLDDFCLGNFLFLPELQ